MKRKIVLCIPTVITFLSAIVCLASLFVWPARLLMALSLLLDVLDGYTARRLDAVTRIGAMLDIRFDSMLAIAVVLKCYPAAMAAIILFWLLTTQVLATYYKKRFLDAGRLVL